MKYPRACTIPAPSNQLEKRYRLSLRNLSAVPSIQKTLESRSPSQPAPQFTTVLIASTEKDEYPLEFPLPDLHAFARIFRGDHADSLNLICDDLMEATNFADNDTQQKFLAEYIESFRTGSLHGYRESQRDLDHRQTAAR